jgi:hypothetical protein
VQRAVATRLRLRLLVWQQQNDSDRNRSAEAAILWLGVSKIGQVSLSCKKQLLVGGTSVSQLITITLEQDAPMTAC